MRENRPSGFIYVAKFTPLSNLYTSTFVVLEETNGLNYWRCFWFISRRCFTTCRVLVTFWLTSQSKLARTPIGFVRVFRFFGRSRGVEHGHLWNFIFREITKKVLTRSNPFLKWTNITGTSREELCTFLYVYRSQVVNIDFKK